jgi:hypothetical protein
VPCLSTIQTEYLNSNAVFKWFEMYTIHVYMIVNCIKWSSNALSAIDNDIKGHENRPKVDFYILMNVFCFDGLSPEYHRYS